MVRQNSKETYRNRLGGCGLDSCGGDHIWRAVVRDLWFPYNSRKCLAEQLLAFQQELCSTELSTV